MRILAFDCCLRSMSVAVLDGERMTVTTEPCDGGQAERLMPMIAAVLRQAGVGYEELDRIAVTLGPGGFTSVRVGIAAARGLALAIGIPAVGQSSLEALAQAALEPPRDHQQLLAVIPAGRGGFYWQAFAAQTAAVLAPARVIEAADVAAEMLTADDCLIGPGAAEVAALYHAAHPEAAPPAILADIVPRADILARSAKHLTPDGELRPIYLRAADARPQTGKALARA